METDRSRIIAFQRCPRERWLAYHAGGSGLQRKQKSLPLQFGSAFHNGAERLLSGDVEMAVIEALEFLALEFSKHQVAFDGETPDDAQKAMEYGREEQMSLAEALLRAWHLYEGESFLNTFEVIEVEREGRANLTIGPMGIDTTIDREGKNTHVPFDDGLTLMFRPDALVRDRASGDLYVVSWKTCATFGKRNTDQARHDMQSMSEVWGIESTWGDNRDIAVEGVLYKWIVKGSRRKDNWDGLYKQNSHLIYGWMKMGAASPEETEWSWSYEWEKEDGSGSSRLGKGWKKVPIWREYPGGVKQWVADLASGQIFPRHVDPLAAVFPQAMPVERRADEVSHWKRQVIQQEQRIARAVEEVNNTVWAGSGEAGPVLRSMALDDHFPQFTHSCHSYSGCSFIPICWDGVPAEPGDLYQIRSANHPEKGDSDE